MASIVAPIPSVATFPLGRTGILSLERSLYLASNPSLKLVPRWATVVLLRSSAFCTKFKVAGYLRIPMTHVRVHVCLSSEGFDRVVFRAPELQHIMRPVAS